jgi:hypothetical protein
MAHTSYYRHMLALAFILSVCPSVLSQDVVTETLILTGKAPTFKLRRDGAGVRCTVDLSLNFVNNGSEPLIILRPHIRDVPGVFWVGGVALARTRAESETRTFIYRREHWPSFYGKAAELAKQLDQATPPAGITRTIQPKEKWAWRTKVDLYIGERSTHMGGGADLGWDEIGRANYPVWLRVGVGIWPFGLESVRGGISWELQRRWQDFGRLWIGGENIHHVLLSEPIMLNLNESSLSSSNESEPNNGMHPTPNSAAFIR